MFLDVVRLDCRVLEGRRISGLRAVHAVLDGGGQLIRRLVARDLDGHQNRGGIIGDAGVGAFAFGHGVGVGAFGGVADGAEVNRTVAVGSNGAHGSVISRISGHWCCTIVRLQGEGEPVGAESGFAVQRLFRRDCRIHRCRRDGRVGERITAGARGDRTIGGFLAVGDRRVQLVGGVVTGHGDGRGHRAGVVADAGVCIIRLDFGDGVGVGSRFVEDDRADDGLADRIVGDGGRSSSGDALRHRRIAVRLDVETVGASLRGFAVDGLGDLQLRGGVFGVHVIDRDTARIGVMHGGDKLAHVGTGAFGDFHGHRVRSAVIADIGIVSRNLGDRIHIRARLGVCDHPEAESAIAAHGRGVACRKRGVRVGGDTELEGTEQVADFRIIAGGAVLGDRLTVDGLGAADGGGRRILGIVDGIVDDIGFHGGRCDGAGAEEVLVAPQLWIRLEQFERLVDLQRIARRVDELLVCFDHGVIEPVVIASSGFDKGCVGLGLGISKPAIGVMPYRELSDHALLIGVEPGQQI